jgi:hypothetical protein
VNPPLAPRFIAPSYRAVMGRPVTLFGLIPVATACRRDAHLIHASCQGAQRGVASGLQLLDRRQIGSTRCYPLIDGIQRQGADL